MLENSPIESQIGRPVEEVSYSSAATRFLSGVYLWMFIGLAATSISAWLVVSNETLLHAIVLNQWMFYGLIIAELAIVVAISAGRNFLSAGTATVLFLLYSVLNGATLSVILLVFTGESILQAFVGAGCLFAAMTIYGYATKRDLTRLGSLLFIGLIALILASIINIFIASSGFDFALSIIGILVFLGLTAYDTQKILRMGESSMMEDSQLRRKATINAALALYLDFINIFLYLLRIFGRRR